MSRATTRWLVDGMNVIGSRPDRWRWCSIGQRTIRRHDVQRLRRLILGDDMFRRRMEETLS